VSIRYDYNNIILYTYYTHKIIIYCSIYSIAKIVIFVSTSYASEYCRDDLFDDQTIILRDIMMHIFLLFYTCTHILQRVIVFYLNFYKTQIRLSHAFIVILFTTGNVREILTRTSEL